MSKSNTPNNSISPKWRMTRICISGFNQIRLLNYIRTERLSVYNLVFVSNSIMHLTIYNVDYKRICSILTRYNYEHSIIVQDLFRTTLAKVIQKIGAIIGVIVFTVAIMLSNTFVWDVRISGLTNVPRNLIENILEENSIHKGIWSGKVDKESIKKQILGLDNVVDVTINMEGTILKIVVFEDLFNGDNDNNNSIVSNYDAIVKKIFVSEGRSVVEVGDKVSQGDELISPIIYDTNGGVLATTNPKGKVYGSVVFNSTKTIPYYETIYKRSGKEFTNTTLKVFGLTIGKNKIPKYKKYDLIQSKGLVFGKSFLPIEYNKNTYFELVGNTVQNDMDAMTAKTISELEDMLILKANGNVVDIKHDIREVIGGVRIDVFVEAYLLLNS